MKTENFQTKTEAEVLAATAAALAKGEDPFGDDGDDEPAAGGDTTDEAAEENPATVAELDEAGDDEGTTDEADEKGEADEGKDDDKGEALSKEALEELAGDDEDDADDAPAAPRYKTVDKDAIAQQRKDLMAEDAKALKDMIDGVIEPEAYSEKRNEIQGKLDQLLVQQTLSEANAQSEQQAHEAAINGIIASAKKAGEIDYVADVKAQKQFDAALRTLLADEDNAGLSQAKLCSMAHRTVLAVRGITAKPAAAAAEPKPKPEPAKARENGKGPTTLRNVPAAATANSGGGLVEQMAALSGDAYQAAFDKLTPAQKAQLRGD